MPFSQIIPLSPSPRVQKAVPYICGNSPPNVPEVIPHFGFSLHFTKN